MNEFEPGFRVSDLYGVIRRRLPLLIIFVIIGAVAASGFLFTYTAEFEATTTLVVQPITSTLNLDPSTTPRAGGQLVPTFAEFVKSDEVAAAVKKQLKLNDSIDDILSNVEVATTDGSMRVDITYTAEDQKEAKEGADAFAALFLEQRRANADRVLQETRKRLKDELDAAQKTLNTAWLTLSSTATGSTALSSQARAQVDSSSAKVDNLNNELDALLVVDTTPGQITQAATIPKDAAGVPTTVIVVGITAFVVLFGLALALLWDRLDPRVTSLADIERISPETSVDILPLGSSQSASRRGSPRAAALNRLVFRLATPGASDSPRAILLAGTGDRPPTELATELNQAFSDAGARPLVVSTVPTQRKGRKSGGATLQSLRPILDGKVALGDVAGNGHGLVILCPEDAADADATINPKSIEQLMGKARSEGFHVVLFASPTPARYSRTLGVAREVNSVVVAAEARSTRAGVRDAVAAMVDADHAPSDVVVA